MDAVPNRGQPALLRVLNDRAALSLLLDHGALTRNEIAHLTGLSKPTAGEIIRRLELAGLIRESGTTSGRRGPNPVLYEVITERTLAVAVDVQFVDVRSAVVDARGRTFPVASRRMTPAEAAAPAAGILSDAVERAAAAAGVDPDDVTEVCAGVQASVDQASDTLTFTDGLLGWPHEQVTETLSRELGVHVTVENDANLAAIAERELGAGAAHDSFALVWLAEGLGLALDLGGVLHRGASGAAGEIGYLSPPADALALDENAPDIAELVSERAITSLGIRHGVVPEGAEWRDVLARLPELDPHHPLVAALGERVGHAILPALAVADPEVVILHGPTGIAAGAPLAAEVTRWLRTHTRWCTAVVPPVVTQTPVLHGARRVLVGRIRSALADSLSDLAEPAGSGQSS